MANSPRLAVVVACHKSSRGQETSDWLPSWVEQWKLCWAHQHNLQVEWKWRCFHSWGGQPATCWHQDERGPNEPVQSAVALKCSATSQGWAGGSRLRVEGAFQLASSRKALTKIPIEMPWGEDLDGSPNHSLILRSHALRSLSMMLPMMLYPSSWEGEPAGQDRGSTPCLYCRNKC